MTVFPRTEMWIIKRGTVDYYKLGKLSSKLQSWVVSGWWRRWLHQGSITQGSSKRSNKRKQKKKKGVKEGSRRAYGYWFDSCWFFIAFVCACLFCPTILCLNHARQYRGLSWNFTFFRQISSFLWTLKKSTHTKYPIPWQICRQKVRSCEVPRMS